jgi:hypothetical protein
MYKVLVLNNGNIREDQLSQPDGVLGPWTIGPVRLDGLRQVTIQADTSTTEAVTTTQSGSTTKTNTGSAVVRAAAGALIAGPTGAIIGAGTAVKTTQGQATSVTNEHLKAEMTLFLVLHDLETMNVVVHDVAAYHQLLALVGTARIRDDDLNTVKDFRRKAEEQERAVDAQMQDDPAPQPIYGFVMVGGFLLFAFIGFQLVSGFDISNVFKLGIAMFCGAPGIVAGLYVGGAIDDSRTKSYGRRRDAVRARTP